VFYAVIPLAWKGVCHIRVMNRAGEELLSKDITVAEEPAAYWQTVVASDARNEPEAAYALASDPIASVPNSNGMDAIPFSLLAPTQPARPATISLPRTRLFHHPLRANDDLAQRESVGPVVAE
jgi:hypothetical protein